VPYREMHSEYLFNCYREKIGTLCWFAHRSPEFTRFTAFAALCVKEGTEMRGLLETRQKVKMCFCMTSFSSLSGKLRSPW
jgi:hypothetical protein